MCLKLSSYPTYGIYQYDGVCQLQLHAHAIMKTTYFLKACKLKRAPFVCHCLEYINVFNVSRKIEKRVLSFFCHDFVV